MSNRLWTLGLYWLLFAMPFTGKALADKPVVGDGSEIVIPISEEGIGSFREDFHQASAADQRCFAVEGKVTWREPKWWDLSLSGSRVVYKLRLGKPAAKVLLTFSFWGTETTEGLAWVSPDGKAWEKVFEYDPKTMPVGQRVHRTVDIARGVSKGDKPTVYIKLGTQKNWGLLFGFSINAYERMPVAVEPYKPGPVPPNGALRYCIHYREVDPDFLYFLQRTRINFLHWHGPFCGYMGLPERARLKGMIASAKETVEQVHAIGAACILYIGPCFSYGDKDKRTILFEFYDKRWKEYEDYFGPKPGDLLEMAQCDAEGTPRPYVYEGQSGYHLCVNSPGVRQYTKGLIRMICEAGGDGSFYDGPYVAQGNCYCRWCRDKFGAWLKNEYPATVLNENFGVTDVAKIEPPRSAKERLWLPWRKFAAWTLYDFMLDTKTYARTLNPNYIMTANYCMWTGEPFSPLRGSAENVEMWSRVIDVVFDEAQYGAGPRTTQGRKLSNSTDYRVLLAASHGKPVALLKTAPQGDTPEAPANLTRLAIAEGAAQGATWQFHYLKPPATAAAVQYNKFLADRADVMTRARPWANVAVWTSLQQAYLDLPTQAMGISRFLADHHIPHKLVIDEDVEKGQLDAYGVIILPEVRMVSEAQLSSLRKFVENGGGLIFLGDCGTMNEWGEPREPSPLMRMVIMSSEDPQRAQVGRGRAGAMRRISLPASPNLGLSPEDEAKLSRLPGLIEWAGDQGLPARVEAGPNIEITTSYDGRRTMLVYLVNYSVDLAGHVEPETNLPVKVRLPRGMDLESAALLSADDPERQDPFPCEVLAPGPDLYAAFVLPRLLIYSQIELRLKPVARSRDLPQMQTQLRGEPAPGGQVTLDLLLNNQIKAQWQLETPDNWTPQTSRVEGRLTSTPIAVPATETPGLKRLRVTAVLPGGETLTDNVWVRVAGPFELTLRVPPHADTVSGRTKVELSLKNRRAVPMTARVTMTPPEGWTASPNQQVVQLVASQVTLMTVFLQSPATPKPGSYEVKAEAVVEGLPPAQATARFSVLEGFQALRAARVGTPPRIDGKLDDACWQGAPVVAKFLRNDGKGPAIQQTRAWAAYDDKALYLAFECAEGEPKTIISLVDRDGGEVWRDDSVEVFLDRTHDHQRGDHYVVNVDGRKTPAGGWQAATTHTQKGWIVEVAIPLSVAPKPGDIWGINLCRTRPARPQAVPEFSSWVYTGGSFHQPGKFGHIVIGGE